MENGFKCETPDSSFSLYGKASCVSRNHCDAAGFVTVVRIESGSKLWAVSTQVGATYEEAGKHKDWARRTWDAAYLEAGDSM